MEVLKYKSIIFLKPIYIHRLTEFYRRGLESVSWLTRPLHSCNYIFPEFQEYLSSSIFGSSLIRKSFIQSFNLHRVSQLLLLFWSLQAGFIKEDFSLHLFSYNLNTLKCTFLPPQKVLSCFLLSNSPLNSVGNHWYDFHHHISIGLF